MALTTTDIETMFADNSSGNITAENIRTFALWALANSSSGDSGGELIKEVNGYRINTLSDDILGINAVNLSTDGSATGPLSFTTGYNPIASGEYATSMGVYTIAAGDYSLAMGLAAEANGNYSTSIGFESIADGQYATALGYATQASGRYSQAIGYKTISSNFASYSEGQLTEASGFQSHSEGRRTKATGSSSHAEGDFSEARGYVSHAQGRNTMAYSYGSHAEGKSTLAGCAYHGKITSISGFNITIDPEVPFPTNVTEMAYIDYGSDEPKVINVTNVSGNVITVDDDSNLGTGLRANEYVFAQVSPAVNDIHTKGGHSEGYATISGTLAHAEGRETKALGNQSHAEGYITIASGTAAHSEGYYSTASGNKSHAEGEGTKATGVRSHAEGYYSTASENSTHAEGYYTTASGNWGAHSEGYRTVASGESSHSEGIKTISLNKASHAAGKYNTGTSTETIHETGIGTGPEDKKNAFEIYTDGRIHAPELTAALITDNRSLITKEYLEANAGGGASELEKITENSNTGWRLLGRNPANYGDIGVGSVDFSLSWGASTTMGATGYNSFATGIQNKASGGYSTVEGYYNTASGEYSHAEGNRTTASAYISHAEGRTTTASGVNGSHAEGAFSVASGEASHAEGGETKAHEYGSHSEGRGTIALNYASHAAGKYNIGTATDTIHETGIGVDNANRKNAFEIYTNGRIIAPELTTALITDNRSLITKEYLEANAGGGGGSSTGLELITENGKTGWRLAGGDSANYGDIGSDAVDLSHSEETSTTMGATGNISTATGYNTTASGNSSHTEGYYTIASGNSSHAEGYETIASGDNSHAEGYHTTASGEHSHAEGYNSGASSSYSHAEGYLSEARGTASHAEGYQTYATGHYSHAEGYHTYATGPVSHVEGQYATASGNSSHAEGQYTTASGVASHAEGGEIVDGYSSGPVASGDYSHAEGAGFYGSAIGDMESYGTYKTQAIGVASHAEGLATIARDNYSHAEGILNLGLTGTLHETGMGVKGVYGTSATVRKNAFEIWNDGRVHAPELTQALITDNRSLITKEYLEANAGGASELEKITEDGKTGWRLLGQNSDLFGDIGEGAVDFSVSDSTSIFYGATGDYSFANGLDVTASGDSSHAEGGYTIASGYGAHAEGGYTEANAQGSHSEGNHTIANGDGSHSEGDYTTASGLSSHAEGSHTEAQGDAAHSEGYYNIATGNSSHAEGGGTLALGNNSHAEGHYTISQNYSMHAAGEYNIGTSPDTIHETGIGTGPSSEDRKNAFEIYSNGRLHAPKLTQALITDNRSLITKEYLEANAGGASELEKITEDGKTGLRLLGVDPAYYGDIGQDAVDLTYSETISDMIGATGDYSFANGYENIASGWACYSEGVGSVSTGTASHAEGYSRATGDNSHSEGNNTHAEADNSHAEGLATLTSGFSSHAEGSHTIALNHYSHAAGKYNIGTSTDTIHETGIGIDEANRKNAFEIYTDGTITAPESTPALIKARGDKAILTKEYGVVSDIGQAGAGAIKVSNLVKISQVDYDNLTPDPDTMYAIF